MGKKLQINNNNNINNIDNNNSNNNKLYNRTLHSQSASHKTDDYNLYY